MEKVGVHIKRYFIKEKAGKWLLQPVFNTKILLVFDDLPKKYQIQWLRL